MASSYRAELPGGDIEPPDKYSWYKQRHAQPGSRLPMGKYDLTLYNGDCQEAVLIEAVTVSGMRSFYLN
jgi:hypothetical protein